MVKYEAHQNGLLCCLHFHLIDFVKLISVKTRTSMLCPSHNENCKMHYTILGSKNISSTIRTKNRRRYQNTNTKLMLESIKENIYVPKTWRQNIIHLEI